MPELFTCYRGCTHNCVIAFRAYLICNIICNQRKQLLALLFATKIKGRMVAGDISLRLSSWVWEMLRLGKKRSQLPQGACADLEPGLWELAALGKVGSFECSQHRLQRLLRVRNVCRRTEGGYCRQACPGDDTTCTLEKNDYRTPV